MEGVSFVCCLWWKADLKWQHSNNIAAICARRRRTPSAKAQDGQSKQPGSDETWGRVESYKKEDCTGSWGRRHLNLDQRTCKEGEREACTEGRELLWRPVEELAHLSTSSDDAEKTDINPSSHPPSLHCLFDREF